MLPYHLQATPLATRGEKWAGCITAIGATMKTDHFFITGQQTGASSAVKLWGMTSIAPGLPNTCCWRSCLAQVGIQRFWDPGTFPGWFSPLPPSVVSMRFLLTVVNILKASLIQSEMFQPRASRNSQHILFRCLPLWSAAVTSSRVNLLEWASERMCLRDCHVQEKVAIPAESDQFYCHLLLKAEIKTCAGNTGRWAILCWKRIFIYMHIFITCRRNMDIPIDQLLIIRRHKMGFFFH